MDALFRRIRSLKVGTPHPWEAESPLPGPQWWTTPKTGTTIPAATTSETRTESGRGTGHMTGRGSGSTVLPWATPARRSAIATVTTRTAATATATETGPAARRTIDTERGGTARKTRDATSPPAAAAAAGGTTAKKGTATGGTNTRRARGARRARRPARTPAETRRTRRPWSDRRSAPPASLVATEECRRAA